MAKGSSGRYRSRYGKKIRDKISEIEEGQKSSYACPECGEEAVVREAKGIWKCKKCGEKFAGGAWKPKTGAQKMVKKAIKKSGGEE
ncbi:MAG: 50S ribosomal protein L37ae [Candidatus Aenigmatarchaeota archaeon]